MVNKINQFLARLDQWAGFPTNARSVIQRWLAYTANILFLVSLVLPAVYEHPVLVENGGDLPGFVIWIFNFLGSLMVPADLFRMIMAIISPLTYSMDDRDLLMAILSFQAALHAVCNFVLLFGAWVRFDQSKALRYVLYLGTLSALGFIFATNSVSGFDPLVGCYVWAAAHVILSASTLRIWKNVK